MQKWGIITLKSYTRPTVLTKMVLRCYNGVTMQLGITRQQPETTVTSKGQVTIPADIRARLGLQPKDKVQFNIAGDVVRLRKAASHIEHHFGTVRSSAPVARRQEREGFEQGVAEEVAAEG